MGRPVDPLVYMITATSAGSGSVSTNDFTTNTECEYKTTSKIRGE